jgi:hypothetical protein
MLSEEEKRGFLEDANSSERRKDFEIMRRNVITHHLGPDSFLQFLTQLNRAFNHSKIDTPPHPAPMDNGKFLI